MMATLAESYQDLHIGSRTFNELENSPISHQYIISNDHLREGSQPPSPLTGAEMSELDVPIQPGLHYSSLHHHAQAYATGPPREGARSVDPYLGAKSRTTLHLRGGMQMIGEEEEREFIEEDTKSAVSRSKSNPAGASARGLGLQRGSSSDLQKNAHTIDDSSRKLLQNRPTLPTHMNLLGHKTSASTFAKLPHSYDIHKTQKNFSENVMKVLTLCDNEKAPEYLAMGRLEKPEYVLKSTLNEMHELQLKQAIVKS